MPYWDLRENTDCKLLCYFCQNTKAMQDILLVLYTTVCTGHWKSEWQRLINKEKSNSDKLNLNVAFNML